MHAEHAELIAALRRENLELNAKCSEIIGLQAVIDGQDKLLQSAAAIIREQREMIDKLAGQLEINRCP